MFGIPWGEWATGALTLALLAIIYFTTTSPAYFEAVKGLLT